jgi:hypothetical protein
VLAERRARSGSDLTRCATRIGRGSCALARLANVAVLVTLLERHPDEPPPADVLRLLCGTERAQELVDGVLVYARVGELRRERARLDRYSTIARTRPGTPVRVLTRNGTRQHRDNVRTHILAKVLGQ